MKQITPIYLLLLLSLVITSCSEEKKENPVAQIEAYQQQVVELNKKIAALESNTTADPAKAHQGLHIPVSTTIVEPRAFSHFFDAAGELETIEEAFVSPETAGQIVDITVKEGEHVKKGQVLAKLNTTVLEKNMQEVKSQLQLAETIFNKQSALWEKNIGSERQYLEAKNSFDNLKNRLAVLQAQYNLMIIKSPIDGIIETINQKEGEMATPGMQFMQIVNMDELYVSAQLSEKYLPVIHTGEDVTILFPSLPGVEMTRPVYRTGNVINKENRTFTVEVKVTNPKGELKPNMLANIRINDYNNPSAIVVPSMLIRNDLNGRFVYIIAEDDGVKVARKQYITTGRSFEDKSEVTSGLKAGDVLITAGYNNVSDGVAVNIIKS